MSDRFFDFKSVTLVHIDVGSARIGPIADTTLAFTDDAGTPRVIDLAECARIYRWLQRRGAFPPAEDFDWAALIESEPGFADVPLGAQAVVGLRGAVDEPPWFQFLDRHRTQFEFSDYDHIRRALLDPLSHTRWYSWDAS
jgi:hypothetical protein